MIASLSDSLGAHQYRVEMTDPVTGLEVLLVIDRVVSGLSGGGIRMARDCSLDTLGELARRMSLKFAVMGIPLGGAKALIRVDPEETGADRGVLERASALLSPFLQTVYLAGEDVGTRGEDIAFVYEHASIDVIDFVVANRSRQGIHIEIPPGVQTADLLGASFADVIAGFGVVECAAAAAAQRGTSLEELRFAVQGFGKVGRATAERLTEGHARVVAIADPCGTLYSPDGLEIAELVAAADATGVIDRGAIRQPCTELSREEWLTLPADVLIPAAIENAIGEVEARAVGPTVQLVIEAANAAVTPPAERALRVREVDVLPDVVASAGSSTAFGLLISGQAGGEDIMPTLSRRMREATVALLTAERDPKSSLRDTAHALALRRLAPEYELVSS